MRSPEGPILIAWASRTGNTETLAQRILEGLAQADLEAQLVPVKEVDWDRLDRWSALVLGSPTYGSGDVHPDWDRSERRLRDLSLEGWPAAAFGCGNSGYSTPWWAVDILENRLKNCGAKILLPSYKADTLTGFRVRDADGWIQALAEAFVDY